MLGNRCDRGVLFSLILLLSLALGLGCRRELPELFDRNIAPETYLTVAPVESLFDGFRVRLHWYGNDPDGEISHYLWAWTDSSRVAQSAWNPESSVEDRIFREGLYNATHLTTKTDSVFLVEANDNGGTSRDLTFSVVAVDDRGRRDPVPARKYFFASVDKRPEIVWVEQPAGTLKVGYSFDCAFTGVTENDPLLGYQFNWGSELTFKPLNADSVSTWTYMLTPEDDRPGFTPYADYFGKDTIRLIFSNDISDPDESLEEFYKYGSFPIKAKCVDISGAVSELSGDPDNPRGTIVPILNLDPDTRLRPIDGDDHPISVTYRPYGATEDITIYPDVVKVDEIDGESLDPGFHYVIEEPLPWGEEVWMRLNYQGWDMDDPILMGADSLSFMIDYEWQTTNLDNHETTTPRPSYPRYPPGGQRGFPEMIDISYPGEMPIFNPAGHDFKMNLGPYDYTVFGYTQDPFGRIDGTPCTVSFSCGYPSVVDSIILTTEYPGLGILPGINLTTLAGEGLVNIDLKAAFMAGSAGNISADPADPRRLIIEPFEATVADMMATYYIILRVYGHDDLRNGASAQLGRIQWDLSDPDYPSSGTQWDVYPPDRFWNTAPDGECVQYCWLPLGPDGDVPPENFYDIRLAVSDNILTVAGGVAPVSLQNNKTVTARFTQTAENQNFEEFIEDVSKGSYPFRMKGRMSELFAQEIKINYRVGF
jgi:hypothetical protein